MNHPDQVYKLARTGNRILNVLGLVVLCVLLAYASYSLYDTHMLESEGLPGSTISFKPENGESYSFMELKDINPEVIGWITIDDTNIDQPVLQGEDDIKYVNTNPLGEFSLTGSIFLSSQNASNFSDPYNLTYGHNINNGGMYGDLLKMLKKDYFESHRNGQLYTPEQNWNLKIFASLEDSAANALLYNCYQYQQDPKMVDQLLDYLREHAECFFEPELKEGQKILAMSTCYEAVTNARVLSFAVMDKTDIQEGDKEWIDS